MKISHILAATGLAVASLTISTSADAKRWDNHRGGWHDRGYRGDYGRGWHGREYRGYRHYGGYRDYGGYWDDWGYRPYRYYRLRSYWRPRCWTEWRYDYRVRVCR